MPSFVESWLRDAAAGAQEGSLKKAILGEIARVTERDSLDEQLLEQRLRGLVSPESGQARK
jgi:hypothetical protein